ncbi:leucine-rich_repeat domain-containing protein [Hexamita inflata]|uniref:Leucine-rich repeat domain-containing protein n=1 Tax=Hexamita inflata TaxID=28002 RepID=A0AA86NQ83_9EUKA|nr:leucine-rich repeat domain-containing protein [Hexamita inflata]
MSGCGLTDISWLQKLCNLKCLSLLNNQKIDQLETPYTFNNIESLNLSQCSLKQISFIKAFVNLKELLLSENYGVEISPLKNLIQLNKLELQCCGLKSLNVLISLVNLKELNLCQNQQLKDITALQHLTKLTNIYLTECCLDDITVLQELIYLKELDLTFNYIIYVDPLKNLTNLKQLQIESNLIQDFSAIMNHPNFNTYIISDQEIPTENQKRFAYKMKCIDDQILLLRQIQKYRPKQKIADCMEQVSNSLNKCFKSAALFVLQIQDLFELDNRVENWQ